MPKLIIKSNIRLKVKEVQGQNEEITSVADEVERELEKKVEFILRDAVDRAKANKRRTLQARDL